MEVLSKGMIGRWILPHLSKGVRGPQPSVATVDIVRAIVYRLKTGCQRRMLPVREFFKEGKLSWSGIYHHHSRWVRDGSWRRVWLELPSANKRHLNLSSMQLDGSQSLAKKQGENIGYQRRRKAKTTNALFLCDSRGQPLAIATPQGSNHNDLYEVGALFSQLCDLISEAGFDLKGVFMNADAGLDAQGLRQQLVKGILRLI